MSATDDQPITGGVCLRQKLDVAGMEDIETAVGEADSKTQAAPLRDPLVES